MSAAAAQAGAGGTAVPAVRAREGTILRARKITKRFGGLIAVHDIDFDIPAGSIVSLIGPNGAGKTTFFNVLSGFVKPAGGTVTAFDEDLLAMVAEEHGDL